MSRVVLLGHEEDMCVCKRTLAPQYFFYEISSYDDSMCRLFFFNSLVVFYYYFLIEINEILRKRILLLVV